MFNTVLLFVELLFERGWRGGGFSMKYLNEKKNSNFLNAPFGLAFRLSYRIISAAANLTRVDELVDIQVSMSGRYVSCQT